MTRVVVDVMLKPEILDPQGQAVANALPRLGVDEVASVRIGRRIELEFEGSPDLDKVNQLADRLLTNPVIEDYTVTIDTAEPVAPTVGASQAGQANEADADEADAAGDPAGEASGESLGEDGGAGGEGDDAVGKGGEGEDAAGEEPT